MDVSLLGTAIFTVEAFSLTTMTYQWTQDGVNIPGGTASILTLDNVGLKSQGVYTVVINNAGGSTTSSPVTLIIEDVPPSITNQPQSEAVSNGYGASFSVGATGTYPLSYQWTFNGTNIPGATNSTLNIASAAVSNAGAYEVVVTNVPGAVTSSVAALTVQAPPAIVSQPQSQAVLTGQTVTLSVSATSQGGINYQWYFNGTALQNSGNFQANLATLTLTNFQTNQFGNYLVVLQNSYGSTTSAVAVLSPNPNVPPSITTAPQSQGAIAGQTTSFSVVAGGSGPLVYQWYFNSVAMAGATNSVLTLAQVQPASSGSYQVVVTNAFGSVASPSANLSVMATAPDLQSPAHGTGGFSFQLQAPVGRTYVVLASTDLVNWTPVYTNVAQSAGVSFTDPSSTTIPKRFYSVQFP